MLDEDFFLFYPGHTPASPKQIKTGLSRLDSFISGTLKTGGLVQFSGEAGTGKSQLLFSILAKCSLVGMKILLCDTQGKFRPERVKQIIDPEASKELALEHIDVLQSGDPFIIYEKTLKAIKSSKYDVLLFDDLSEPFLREGFRSKESAMLSLLGKNLNIWGVIKGSFVFATQRLSFNLVYQQSIPLGLEFLSPYLISSFRLSKMKDYYLIRVEGLGEVSRFIIHEEGLKEI